MGAVDERRGRAIKSYDGSIVAHAHPKASSSYERTQWVAILTKTGAKSWDEHGMYGAHSAIKDFADKEGTSVVVMFNDRQVAKVYPDSDRWAPTSGADAGTTWGRGHGTIGEGGMSEARPPSRDERKTRWMRAFGDAALELGAHPGQIEWQRAEFFFHQGESPKVAAERIYGGESGMSETRVGALEIGDAVQFRWEPGTGGVIQGFDGESALVSTPRGERRVPVSGLVHVRPEHEPRVRRSVARESGRGGSEPRWVPPSLSQDGITPVMLELLFDGVGDGGRIRPGMSVVYDRAYESLRDGGYVVLKRAAPGLSSFGDYYVLTDKGSDVLRRYRLEVRKIAGSSRAGETVREPNLARKDWRDPGGTRVQITVTGPREARSRIPQNIRQPTFRVTIVGGGTTIVTQDEFFRNNPDISDDERAEIRSTLSNGKTYYGGGGASPRWSIARTGRFALIPNK